MERLRVEGMFLERLRGALAGAGFTYQGVADLLGARAHAALGRNETLPALERTRGGSPLETLTRLWLLQRPVPAAAAERALPDLVEPLCRQGLLERSGGEVRALLDLRPHASEDRDLWVVSDLTPGLDGAPVRMAADHVLGVSSAATSLAQLTVRREVGRALDLGTGCGVQALHLAAHAAAVVATDVNARALGITRFNAALNGVDLDVREGSLFDPVVGERFDLVVANPPFVISPGTRQPLAYRDSGLPGDRVVEQIVRELPRQLAPGGIGQVLTNWLVLSGQPWDERLRGWLHGTDAWVVQREVLDLPSYVELWLKDEGVHPATGGHVRDYRERYDAWLGWLEEQGAEGVGFGWVSLRPGSGRVRLEEWPFEVEQPIGPEVLDRFARVEALTGLTDDQLLERRLTVRPDVVQETRGAPGAADPWDIVLRQQRGMRRARKVDTAEAALAGACDGELSVGQILGALADLLESEAGALRSAYLPVVRELVTDGFLELS